MFDFRQKCAQCHTLEDTDFFRQFSGLGSDCTTVRLCPSATDRFCVTVAVEDTQGVVKTCSTQGSYGPPATCITKYQEQVGSRKIYCVAKQFCEANGCNVNTTCSVNATMCGKKLQ